ncbi:MAG: hypothetical protein Q9191_006532, partial [Dirinaria sp. TL-2023a]
MDDDAGERAPKRIRLDQAFWRADGEGTLGLSQTTNQNNVNSGIPSQNYLANDEISRMTALDAQITAHGSQSAMPTMDIETLHAPEFPTQCEQTATVPQEGFGEQVCFGMLDNIPIGEPRADINGAAPVSAPAGRLDPHYSKLFKVLNEEPCIDLQAMLAYNHSQLPADRSSKGRGRRVVQTKVTLSVNIYGSMQIQGKVGDFLSCCGDFLQPPLRCDRNVYYQNPQSLSGRNGRPPKTLEISQNPISYVETLSEETDPSSVLEAQDSYQETECPAIIRTSLYSHQKQALTFMLGRETSFMKAYDEDRFWRTDDHATDWLRSSSQALGIKATILVAPSSLVRTWEGELIKHVRPNTLRWRVYHGRNRSKDIQDTLSCDLVITTYNVLATEWGDADRKSKPLFSKCWRRIVLDEGHEIRTGTTLRARSVCALQGHFRWVVTGTPIQNRFEDLASLFNFLNAYPDHDLKSLTRMLRAKKTDADLKRALLSICLRRSKAIINLPSRIDEIHKVKFDDHEVAAYNRTKDGIIDYLQTEVLFRENATYSNILVRINTLRQMCNLGIHHPNHAQQPTQAQTHKSVIFSFWTSTLDLVGKALDDIGFAYTRIDGSVPNGQRQQILKSFDEGQDIRALLISLKCGSSG